MELTANTREILGKKVKVLRRQGITPVHLFGHSIEPLPLQCDTSELKKVLTRTGTTGLINLKIGKARKTRNVMAREVQIDPITDELLHVDFYQVRMEEKIRVEVPIIMVGEAPALKLKENFLTHELTSLTVECLPDEIPSRVELDLSSLEEAEQTIHVKDLSLAEGITVLTNPEQMIAKISAGFVEKAVGEEGVAAPERLAAPGEESTSTD
ncbi:MAG: 50S ribosomal protein L25 [Dehalococcoidales bacterium]